MKKKYHVCVANMLKKWKIIYQDSKQVQREMNITINGDFTNEDIYAAVDSSDIQIIIIRETT